MDQAGHLLRPDNNLVAGERPEHWLLPDRAAGCYTRRWDHRMRNMRWDYIPRLDTNSPRSKNTGRRRRTRSCCDGCATSFDRATRIYSYGKQHTFDPASFGFLQFACFAEISRVGPWRYSVVLER